MPDERMETELIDVGEIEAPPDDDITEQSDNELPDDILSSTARSREDTPAVASTRDRFAALLIDLACLYVIYWPIMLIYRTVVFGDPAGPIPVIGMNGLVLHGVYLLICLLWFAIPEMAFQASPGKILCRLRVLDRDGSPPSFTSVLVRNVLRPVDIILFPLLVSAACLEWSRFHRRIGDLAAGTVVVKRLSSPSHKYRLSYEIFASATRRTLAFTIDLAMFGSFVFGYLLLLSPERAAESLLLTVLLPVVIFFAISFTEGIFGTTPGKWILGMAIVTEEGNPLTLDAAIVRTIWRALDTNFMAFLTVMISNRRQRSGDTAAGSLVICSKRDAKGFISVIVWVLLAVSMLYVGRTNRDSFLSPDFQMNFLPSLGMGQEIKASMEKVDVLSVLNFSFAEGEAKIPRQPSIFVPGETIFIQFGVGGFAQAKNMAWLEEDFSITYPDGNVGLKLENISDFRGELREQGPILFENSVALPPYAEPGRYTLTITIRDRIKKNEIKEQRFFYVTPSNRSEPSPDIAPEQGGEEETPAEDEGPAENEGGNEPPPGGTIQGRSNRTFD